MTDNLAPTNLHTLTVSLEAKKRLLERRTADKVLASVDPALIGAAIEAKYEELRCMGVSQTRLRVEEGYLLSRFHALYTAKIPKQ